MKNVLRKIQLLLVFVLLIFVFVGCGLQNDTTKVTTTTSATTELVTSLDFYNGIPINNEASCDELITNLIEDDIFYPNDTMEYTLDDINALATIECLRKVNENHYYSIHKSVTGVYIYYFYEFNDSLWEIMYGCRFSQDVSYDDLEALLLEEATIEEVRNYYSDLITYDFNYDGSVTSIICLFTGDVYRLNFGIKYIEDLFLREVNLFKSSDENIYFDMLFDKDLPNNLIYN